MPRTKGPRAQREARHKRVRKTVVGTPERPRLCVFRSLKNIYAQIIDDTQHNTLVSASTMDKDLSAKMAKTDQARLVGAAIAKRASEKGIAQVVFDRGGYRYHGRVKTLAEAARKEGLVF